MTKQALTGDEKLVISRIAEMLPGNKRLQLMADMENAIAEARDDDGSRVVFQIIGYQRPPYKGQHSFGIAGKLSDKDGTELWLDLYADENDRLLELEIIRPGPGRILGPDWSSLVLF